MIHYAIHFFCIHRWLVMRYSFFVFPPFQLAFNVHFDFVPFQNIFPSSSQKWWNNDNKLANDKTNLIDTIKVVFLFCVSISRKWNALKLKMHALFLHPPSRSPLKFCIQNNVMKRMCCCFCIFRLLHEAKRVFKYDCSKLFLTAKSLGFFSLLLLG